MVDLEKSERGLSAPESSDALVSPPEERSNVCNVLH